jgi:hypothetical protein
MKTPSPDNTPSSEDGPKTLLLHTISEIHDEMGLDPSATAELSESLGNHRPTRLAFIEFLTTCSRKGHGYDFEKNILGKDFITPEQVARGWGEEVLTYTEDELQTLRKNIPSPEMISMCAEGGFILLPPPPKPLSLLEIRTLDPTLFHTMHGSWYETHSFASRDKTTSSGWMAIRKTPNAASFGHEFDEQRRTLLRYEVVPNIADAAWAITSYIKTRGEKPLGEVFGRTSSAVNKGGNLVSIGYNPGQRGLAVEAKGNDRRIPTLGLWAMLLLRPSTAPAAA